MKFFVSSLAGTLIFAFSSGHASAQGSRPNTIRVSAHESSNRIDCYNRLADSALSGLGLNGYQRSTNAKWRHALAPQNKAWWTLSNGNEHDSLYLTIRVITYFSKERRTYVCAMDRYNDSTPLYLTTKSGIVLAETPFENAVQRATVLEGEFSYDAPREDFFFGYIPTRHFGPVLVNLRWK